MSSMAMTMLERAQELVPQKLRDTAMIRAFTLFKIPALFFARPTVVELSDERCVVRIRLTRRTKNHVGAMYIGCLVAGADLAGGLIAMRFGQQKKVKLNLLFKDLKADFLARAEGDVYFTCEQGSVVHAAVEKAIATGERQNLPVEIVATAPDKKGDEPVARFTLTLSMKHKA